MLRRELKSLRAPVIGLRYFNVYGPNEQHKGRMASVAFHQYFQYRRTGKVKLFEGCLATATASSPATSSMSRRLQGAYALPRQARLRRLQLAARAEPSRSTTSPVRDQRPARTRRQAAAHARRGRRDGRARVHRVPRSPQGQVPAFTQANLENLRKAGCDVEFRTVQEGTREYMQNLLAAFPNVEE